jgi:tetratricopeptide (TPR) repeat protein
MSVGLRRLVATVSFCAVLATLGFAAASSAGPEDTVSREPAGGLWAEGDRLEREGRYLASAQKYEEVSKLRPGEAHVLWRIARNHYMHAKSLSFDDPEGRKQHFELTQQWAARGVEADPACAECYLYEFVGLSRIATTNGILSSASNAKEMAALLDRAEELGPKHVDNALNSELANLYYAAGVFYRSVPESSMISWAIGVKGDRARAIAYLRKATEISGQRVDYHIELGTALMCAGTEDSNPSLVEEGAAVLSKIPSLPSFQPSDEIDRRAAPILIQHPDRACEFSREDFATSPTQREP